MSKTPRLWIDLASELPWLWPRPYLVESPLENSLVDRVAVMGFRVVQVKFPQNVSNSEEALLIELSNRLDFSEIGAGSWAAYSDRLWDLQMSEDEPPLAVIIGGLDELLRSDVHSFVRCVHNLLSMTEAVGLADERADLQIEYFFVGSWTQCPR
ncbi:hypothetical protein [Peterkaempfera sp. SMS 1(5)a]|uniref:hypothetical protein n=1 Tax=Peterkaempfera podocarpi TaxID=3232308 RepID=UPI00366EFE7A